MISLKLVSLSPSQEKVISASQVTGPRFTGLDILRMVEKSPAPEASQEDSQRPSHLVLTKSSHAGTSLLLNSRRDLRLDSTAHPTTLMVVLSPSPHSVVSQSHSTLMLNSTLKFLIATESQSSPNRLINHTLPPCNQADACTSTLKNPHPRLPHSFSPVRTTGADRADPGGEHGQSFHATLMSGPRKTRTKNSSTRKRTRPSQIELSNGNFATKV